MKKWFIILLFFAANALAEPPMMTKVINLQYRTANQIIPLIQPLLHEGERVSGSGQTLVVKVAPQTLTQLRSVLHQLDKPPITFQITVYQGDPDWLSTQNSDTQIINTPSHSNQRQQQSVTVMNGESAFVSTGQDQPVVSSVGVGFQTGISYDRRLVQNGLVVEPSLQGQQVRLKVRRIRERDSRVSSQEFDQQQVVTTVMVPLDKWVSLASPQGNSPVSSNTQIVRAGDQFPQNSTLYIKVNVVGDSSSDSDN